MSLGYRTLKGDPVIASSASPPPTPTATMPKPARVRRVAVGADHHPAGERVVLEHDLVDDPGAGLPEADAVLRARGAEEVVDLRVGVERAGEVGGAVRARLDEVVAVHGRGELGPVEARAHELEHHDLGQRVLERDAVGIEVGVGAAALEPADRLRIRGGGSRGSSRRACSGRPSCARARATRPGRRA